MSICTELALLPDRNIVLPAVTEEPELIINLPVRLLAPLLPKVIVPETFKLALDCTVKVPIKLFPLGELTIVKARQDTVVEAEMVTGVPGDALPTIITLSSGPGTIPPSHVVVEPQEPPAGKEVIVACPNKTVPNDSHKPIQIEKRTDFSRKILRAAGRKNPKHSEKSIMGSLGLRDCRNRFNFMISGITVSSKA
jgi:hypothetical protein